MKEVYNLHQHTECVIIHIGKSDITIVSCPTSNISFKSTSYKRSSEKACITYNKQKTEVLDWGNLNFALNHTDYVEISNFMNGLYVLFEKGKANWDEDDLFLLRAVSDFLRLKIHKLIQEPEKMIEDLDALHYVFVVSSEWKEEIREDVLRPIFIQSGLISKDDNNDRVLFYSDLECIFYYIQQEIISVGEVLVEAFRKQRHSAICKVTSLGCSTLSVHFDLIETQPSLYDFANPMLFPKTVRSSSFSITTEEIKRDIKLYLKENMFPSGTDTNQEEKVERLTEHVYFNIVRQMNKYYKNKCKHISELMKPWMTDTERWGLDGPQEKFIKSVCIFNVCTAIGTGLLQVMKGLLSNSFGKQYKMFIVKNMYSSNVDFHPSLLAWLNAILECNRHQLSYFITSTKNSTRVWSFYSTHIVKGAAVTAFEAIRNSNIYTKPCILSKNISGTCSSVFLNAKPNVIFNIADISFKSTFLSYSLLNDDGIIEKVFDNEYFEFDSLPPLEAFYKVSDVVALNVAEQFFSFMEKYSNDDPNCPSLTEKTETEMHAFESILNKDSFGNEPLVSTRQQKYIKRFILMYLSRIKQIISSRLSTGLNFITTMDTKIGYIISIEKMLLDSIIGTKTEFKQFLLKSGIFREDGNLKKLKIITQGEELLPVIQNFWKLEFPIKTYFVLAQLHENYIQLTLNQVVTTSSSEQEESIVLKDKIVPIQNIYDLLCIHIWSYITEHSQLIQLCDVHFGGDNCKFIQLFSLNTKTQFLSNLKQFISENILTKKADLEMDKKNMIQLNDDCSCRVSLTVTDIVEIAFKPILQNIASLASASLINTNYFGSYKNINYLFNLIYFNYNPQFQIILANILKSELDSFNEGQEIEAFCEVIPELPKKILEHTIGQKPFMYKYFQFGNLHQISSSNYGFIIAQYAGREVSESQKPLYKDKKSDKNIIVCEDIAFSLFKKGDIIRCNRFKRVFYLKKQSDEEEEVVTIELLKFKDFNGLKSDGTIPLKGNIFKSLDYFSFDLKVKNYKKGSDLPIMISMKAKGYSSSLKFSVKEVGQDKKSYGLCFVEVGEPLTLARF